MRFPILPFLSRFFPFFYASSQSEWFPSNERQFHIFTVDVISDSNSCEVKSCDATGVTYVDSDVNINAAVTHSESRYYRCYTTIDKSACIESQKSHFHEMLLPKTNSHTTHKPIRGTWLLSFWLLKHAIICCMINSTLPTAWKHQSHPSPRFSNSISRVQFQPVWLIIYDHYAIQQKNTRGGDYPTPTTHNVL